ncbi:ABC transporter permease [Pseudomonas sp. Milli4]|uniref:Transport permease protein n=1 Tax=Pseudomonas schmalbachii TaxID=2816993 RepID=A0ABS3TLR1_9PSED|nr:ABC transporter permease [Pseudomonas schmalbachii]
MARRDVESRYRGALLGRVWMFLSPLLMLLVYTFVFGHVLKSRWGSDQDTASFALALFSGLLLNGILGDCLSRAASVVHGHANYVKKLVFPLEVLPLSLLLSSLVNALFGYLILMMLMPLLGHPLTWGVLLLPFFILPFLLCVGGLSYVIAALGAYFRDVNQIVQFFLVLTLFLSPVLYPLTALPEDVRPYLALNPLTIPVEMIRSVLFGTPMPASMQVIAYFAASCLVALLGLGMFLRVKDGFADVL